MSDEDEQNAPGESSLGKQWRHRPVTLELLETGLRSLQAVADELRRLASEVAPLRLAVIEGVEQDFLHIVLEIFGPESRQYHHLRHNPLMDPRNWQLWESGPLAELAVAGKQERVDRAYQTELRNAIASVGEIRRMLEARRQELLEGLPPLSSAERDTSVAARLEQILDSFHAFARVLRDRPRGRAPVTIADEYDVQYLLRALLAANFADVRPEEPTPSHAGGSARMDFLLKSERVVVEAKMTREGLTDRKVGEELTIDIARYRNHHDCDTLYCFVYDPDHRLANPLGVEADLERSAPGFVRVFVRPKR